MPLPMVLATAVPKTKAAMKFQKAAQSNGAEGSKDASGDDRGDGIGGIVPAVRELEGEGEEDDDDEERRSCSRGSGALQDDAFDDVGDVFALVNGGFDDFEDFFPLDDLDGVFFFVEELGDEGAAEAVAVVFVAIDLDAVLEGFLGFSRARTAASTSAVAETEP